MSETEEQEYQEHFSPDGEYIQYQMEHPEEFDHESMNTSNTIEKRIELFREKFNKHSRSMQCQINRILKK